MTNTSRSGIRAFVVTAAGDVLACADADGRYPGAQSRPPLDPCGATPGRIDGDADLKSWAAVE